MHLHTDTCVIDLLTSAMKRNNIRGLICVFAIVAVVHATAESCEPKRAKVQSCGVSKRGSGLIVRGQRFLRGDFPWIVALILMKKNPPEFFCGGTIISATFVLSGKKTT